MGAADLNPIELGRGFAYLARGYRVLRRHPDLARYWLMPIVLTALALGGSVWLSLRYHDDLLRLLWSPPAASDGALWRFLYATASALSGAPSARPWTISGIRPSMAARPNAVTRRSPLMRRWVPGSTRSSHLSGRSSTVVTGCAAPAGASAGRWRAARRGRACRRRHESGRGRPSAPPR